MGLGNDDLEKQLDELPELVAGALEVWRTATLDREKCEALIYLREKGLDQEKSAAEIKAIVTSDDSRYTLVLNELKAEAEYIRLLERLQSVKKAASLRTAF